MEEIAELLKHEMSSAFEVRDEESLDRCVNLIAQNAVGRREYERENSGIRGEIKILAEKIDRNTELMRRGFEAMDKRFESMDQRFEALQHNMDKRFESVQHTMDKRFESMDQRFDTVQHNMDKRFRNMFTFMTLGFSLLSIIAVLFKFLV